MLQRLAPEAIEQFILGQLDRAGLGHNTFTSEALALIVRSSHVAGKNREVDFSTFQDAHDEQAICEGILESSRSQKW